MSPYLLYLTDDAVLTVSGSGDDVSELLAAKTMYIAL